MNCLLKNFLLVGLLTVYQVWRMSENEDFYQIQLVGQVVCSVYTAVYDGCIKNSYI